MGPQEDYIETVFTCEGDINDPNLQSRLEDFQSQLKELLLTDKRKLILKKVEPWNSVRVTFNIPKEAALRLKQLAQQGNATLRQLGVLAVQIEGDQTISLTIAGRNNARAQLIFRTADDTVNAPNLSLLDTGGGGSQLGSPGPTNVQSTRKNIEDYLRQGASIFDTLGIPGSENARPVSSSAGTPPQNLITQITNTCNINSERLTHTASAGSSRSYGHRLSNVHADMEQNAFGSDKPPPPPYPEGSTWFNNVAKGMHGLPTTTSPLLVNLLQNDPTLAIAGMNNFINARMLPPTGELSPPTKKKRKPRKPKAGCEGEATIQSIPNPVLSPYAMPLSGNSNILPVPMVTQALAANTQPSVTYSKSVPSADLLFSSEESRVKHNVETVHKSVLSGSIAHPSETQHIYQESTVGKIINPYTGHLEPMEHSDLNPSKNSLPFERLSPQGLKNPNTEHKLLSKEKLNHVSLNQLPSNTISHMSSLPISSTGNISLQQLHSNKSIGSQRQGSQSLSTPTMSSSTSQNHDFVQSSPIGSVAHHSNVLLDKKSQHLIQVSGGEVIPSTKELYKSSVVQELHNIKDTIKGGTADALYSSHKLLSINDSEKLLNTENLLNPHKYPAKKAGSSTSHCHGIDSENLNHSKTIHEAHMQNDVGAVSVGCTIETNSKTYFNDSGVGSSSERSDDTPSDAGDSDMKSTHNHVDEFSKSVCHDKQNLIHKSDQHFITVGYAMSNQHHSEKYNNIANSLTIDKALNHPAIKRQASDMAKLNNDLTDHQVAMMHLFNKNKQKKSPKHFLHEDSLSKEHLQLLQKVESMQFLKDNFQSNAKHEKSNPMNCSHLSVPNRGERQKMFSSGAKTPPPRLMNHEGKDTSDRNMCNKSTRHSAGNTPVSEVEALHNEIFLNSYLHQSQKKQETKAKSPISGAKNDFSSYENVISMNSSLERIGESLCAQGILKNDILNNIKRHENVHSLTESESAKVSKSGSYKRRSSASSNMNQLPQQFFDPKKLTESVQKLVKPLLSAESSALPHSQRHSTGNINSKSPQPLKIESGKDNGENVLNGPLDLESISNTDSLCDLPRKEPAVPPPKDPLKVENDLSIKLLNSSNFNHVLSERTKVNGSDNGNTSETFSAKIDSGNHSSNSQDKVSLSNVYSQQSDIQLENSELSVSSNCNFSNGDSGIHDHHKQFSNENVKVPIEVTVSNADLVSPSSSEKHSVPTSNTKSSPEQITSETDKCVKNKNTRKTETLCNTGVDYSILKVNCDSEKTSPKSSQKSPNLSPVKKGKSEENRPIKLHLSHGMITNSPPFSKEELANETITVITRTDRKTENSTGEPTVPPLVLKVSRKPAVVEQQVEQKHEESQALTMSLRARKASDAAESGHCLRPPKPARQKSIEQDLEQLKTEESSKTVRQSRRRKTASLENDIGQETEKKPHIEIANESEQKVTKMEESQIDNGENLTLFDTVKSGLRARPQNKSEERVKVSPKENKQNKSIEEDLSGKKNNQCRKSRQSPTATDKTMKEPREKSPGRLSRTRSGQISPSAEDDSSKRSTRSAKPKQTIDTQNDATETLPPANKRRRTTSRDHR